MSDEYQHCGVCGGPSFLCGGCPLGVPRGMAPPQRVGNWLQTIGGRAFYPLDPRSEDVSIEDIAHALSFVCRFGGHCTRFYCVAEHCVRVSKAIEAAGGSRDESFAGLLHDAAEAYLGDMIWPLKQAHALVGYKGIERMVEAVIFEKFGLPAEMPSIVKHFDLVLLSTEKRDLMVDGKGREDGSKREVDAARERLGAWHSDATLPLPAKIWPLDSAGAKRWFLQRFDELGGAR